MPRVGRVLPSAPAPRPGWSSNAQDDRRSGEVLDDGARQHAAPAPRRLRHRPRGRGARDRRPLETARADAATRVLVHRRRRRAARRAPTRCTGRRPATCPTARSGRSSAATPTAPPLLTAVFERRRRASSSPRRPAGRACAPSADRCRRAMPDAFVEALSLGRWLLEAPHCPACGALTQVARRRLVAALPVVRPAALPAHRSGGDRRDHERRGSRSAAARLERAVGRRTASRASPASSRRASRSRRRCAARCARRRAWMPSTSATADRRRGRIRAR